MRSSRRGRAHRAALTCFAIASAWTARAHAQQQPQGFAVERLYQSAPGGGWVVMDDLSMHGGLGGAMAVTGGYAREPLRVTDGASHLAVVKDEAFTDFGFAVTYERFRLYMNLEMPLDIRGESGTVGGYQFVSPQVNPAATIDTLPDPRIGFDARLVGEAKSPFRLGVGAQLIVPSGNRSDYDSDGTYRAMGRVLAAGNVGALTYAAQVGIHVRPLDDAPVPGSPQGSEALFGVAAGPRLGLGGDGHWALVAGPEVFGASALRSLLGSHSTALEALVSGRLEETGEDGAQLRFKLGAGGGLDPVFGAPEWRIVFGVEVFAHGSSR